MPYKTYIVDDETQARERLIYLINHFLKDKIHIVGESKNPKESISKILNLLPDILLLDVEMPEMTGLELAKQLRDLGFKGEIVFVTAYDQYAIKAIRANAFDYILKPVDVDVLKEAIERLILKSANQFNKNVIENFQLSEREVELISYLAQGLSSEEIAKEMFLSKYTVDTHRRNIHLKTGTKNAVELLNLLRN